MINSNSPGTIYGVDENNFHEDGILPHDKLNPANSKYTASWNFHNLKQGLTAHMQITVVINIEQISSQFHKV